MNAEFADASQTAQKGEGVWHLRRALRGYATTPSPSDDRPGDCQSCHSRASGVDDTWAIASANSAKRLRSLRSKYKGVTYASALS